MTYPNNKKQLLWSFRQSLKIGLPCAGLLTVVLAGIFIYVWSFLSAAVDRATPLQSTNSGIISSDFLSRSTACGIVFLAALLAILFFRYLYRREDTDRIHALPISRRNLFLGKILGGLLCLLIPLVFSSIFQMLLSSIVFRGFRLGTLPGYLLSTFLLAGAVFALAVLGTVLSGSILQALAVMGILAFFLPTVLSFGSMLMRNTIPGYNWFGGFGTLDAGWFSPLIALVASYMHGADLNAFGRSASLLVFVWAVLGVLMLLLAYLGFCRRKSEQLAAYSWLKGILSACAGVAAAIYIAAILTMPNPGDLAIWLQASGVSLVAAVLCQFLFFHSLRPLKKRLLPVGASLILTLAFLFSITLGLGLDTEIPFKNQLISAAPLTSPADLMTDEGRVVPEMSDSTLADMEQLQKLLVEASRERGYPYPLGQESRAPTSEFGQLSVILGYLGEGQKNDVMKSYRVELDGEIPSPESLGGKVLSQLQHMSKSPDYVSSQVPLNGIDALAGISLDGVYRQQREMQEADSREFRFLSDMENETEFRQELENALRADFAAGRQWLSTHFEKHSYVLEYGNDIPFTARGGLIDGQPIAGKNLQFLGGDTYCYNIYPQMQETYSLLKETFG